MKNYRKIVGEPYSYVQDCPTCSSGNVQKFTVFKNVRESNLILKKMHFSPLLFQIELYLI